MNDEINALKAHVKCLYHLLFCFLVLAVLNFACALVFFQMEANPNWDFIAVTLTIFEILLAGALIGGFWMVRGAAEKRAADEARVVATDVASKVARERALAWLEVFKSAQGEQNNSTTDLTDMINFMGADQNGGENGE